MLKRLMLSAALCVTAFAAGAQELPAAIKQRGAIIAAVIPNYPPLEMKNPQTGELTGFDIELGNAIAAKLGVRMQWQETSFEQMLAAVRTGRVDIILSGMSDLPARQETATFINYIRSGTQFFTQHSRAAEFPNREALCGKTVGASRRTSLPAEIKAFSDANCVAHGRPEIRYVGTEGSADARTQLRQGRIDAAMQGSETLPYIMGLEPNTFALVGEPTRYTLMGIATAKEAEELRQAIVGALKALIADGTYKQLLVKWQLQPSELTEITINAGR
ncbi:ABC transporter substrate-binding protein [Phreatobacter cathodiphilus]|uniref:ABC transporter substrate-binding protein n=1 Tax=Phreatobacter cathodiphilus TaxID=1868589 RepID=A0A2S0NAD5_9HYPH|nr:ABC transporter substrate-binding protein [Phreatobacter cathodiphilus]AVO45108.1 ABC transporter substrate-binding protein [Phreatobacter cathodiphilus]